MRKQIPNLLTVARLILSGLLFALLSQYRYVPGLTIGQQFLLLYSIGVFILAAITDALDGYLARRWKVESRFGRIMDPVSDKLLILGSFIFLAGPSFTHTPSTGTLTQITGVYPWMVAMILFRELLVTSIRSVMESSGIKFGANIFGKLKMILQSIVVPIVLLLVCFIEPDQPRNWAAWLRDILVYATVIVTVISGIPYIMQARRALREQAG